MDGILKVQSQQAEYDAQLQLAKERLTVVEQQVQLAPTGGEVGGAPTDNSELGKRVGALETNQALLRKQTQETNSVVAGLQGPVAEMSKAVREITAHL